MLGCLSGWVRSCRERSGPYWLPRSVGLINPAASCRGQRAMDHAWGTSSARRWWAMDQPTSAREPRSSTTARDRPPSPGGRSVRAPPSPLLGAWTVHSRCRAFGATVWAWPAAVGAWPWRRVWQRRPAWASTRPIRRRRPGRPACAHRGLHRGVPLGATPRCNTALHVVPHRLLRGDWVSGEATRRRHGASRSGPASRRFTGSSVCCWCAVPDAACWMAWPWRSSSPCSCG